jgi:crotonobetaine/carnitine-CoA ligase
VDGAAPAPARAAEHFAARGAAGRDEPPGVDVGVYDPAVVLFTSGTTGPSKGALRSHRANTVLSRTGIDLMDYGPGEVLFNAFPLFHANARYNSVLTAMIVDGTVVLHDRFSVGEFWDVCRREQVTAFNYMGAVLMMLHKQPPRPDDADNPVRRAFGAPAPVEIFHDFQARFGVQLVEVYGSTELGIATMNTVDEFRLGSCGRAAPACEIEIHDEHDETCPPGVAGEIVARSRLPSAIFDEYVGMPAATVTAFRNQWFHTGDRATMDADGYVYYLDRTKDCIRRRGENISSWEVERSIAAHADVAEVAVVGVPSDLTEEEVLAVVVPRAGAGLTPEQLLDHCQARLPHFAVPRYVRFVTELPKTPSQRTEKYKLREAGVTADTWDRVRAGYEVARG